MNFLRSFHESFVRSGIEPVKSLIEAKTEAFGKLPKKNLGTNHGRHEILKAFNFLKPQRKLF